MLYKVYTVLVMLLYYPVYLSLIAFDKLKRYQGYDT